MVVLSNSNHLMLYFEDIVVLLNLMRGKPSNIYFRINSVILKRLLLYFVNIIFDLMS